MPVQTLAPDSLSSVAVLLPGRSLALLACSCRGMAARVKEAVWDAARSLGRRVVDAPDARRWLVAHAFNVQTWPQWHDAGDEIWTNITRGDDDMPFDVGALGRWYRLRVVSDHGALGTLLRPSTCGLGVSLALLPNGTGQLLVCSPRMPDGSVRHALCPLQLRKRNAGSMHVDLRQFAGRCALVGSRPSDRDYDLKQEEARRIVHDFAPELLRDFRGSDEFTLKLYPAEAGLKFRFDATHGAPTGDGERPLASTMRRCTSARRMHVLHVQVCGA